ncbi:MAG: GntR family transcriptional regulator [Pseudomonadota bacterium]
MPKSQEKVTLSPEVIARRIMDLISVREIAPGERLTEAFVATRFGVGRTAVREALQILAARRIVEMEPNKGARIVRLTPSEAREVMDIRAGLYRVAMERFVVHASPEQKKRLAEDALDLANREAQLDRKEFMGLQRQLNTFMVAATESHRLMDLLLSYSPGLPNFFAPMYLRTDEAKRRIAAAWLRFGKAAQAGNWESALSEFLAMHREGAEEALNLYEDL